MPEMNTYKIKVCLIGENGVGKTSLIRRFVFNEFEDKYIKTIGTKITKKNLRIKNPKNGVLQNVTMIIWDIMGDKGFRQLLQEAYFFGTKGIVGICDVTRKDTLSDLQEWMDAVHSVTQEVPTIFLGNKSDLSDKQEVDLNEIKNFASRYEKSEAYLTSAKTGLNVEFAFKNLGGKILGGSAK